MGECVHNTRQWRGLVYRHYQSDCLVSRTNLHGVKAHNHSINLHLSNLRSYHTIPVLSLCAV